MYDSKKRRKKTLDRCLGSVWDLVDEIIIVDTGSDDSTEKIAEKYTDKIYHFPWADDFSAARNFSFQKLLKTISCGWTQTTCFSQEGKKDFIDLKNRGFESADAVMMPYHTSFDEKRPPCFFLL